MVSRVFITEFTDSGPLVPDLPQEPINADQVIDFTAGATASAAFKNNTKLVRIHIDAGTPASIVFGTAPVATTSNRRIAANTTEYFGVPPGQAYKVSAIVNT